MSMAPRTTHAHGVHAFLFDVGVVATVHVDSPDRRHFHCILWTFVGMLQATWAKALDPESFRPRSVDVFYIAADRHAISSAICAVVPPGQQRMASVPRRRTPVRPGTVRLEGGPDGHPLRPGTRLPVAPASDRKRSISRHCDDDLGVNLVTVICGRSTHRFRRQRRHRELMP